ncbi:MAG TPA: type 4a pilus biogenesis protein PilO [Gemmatimonadaceae bacterium]|nr:type 4a pilus biogenesis protein PilO [Gemmatimonadaceae bacterium]
MAILPQNPRDQKLVFVGILAIALAAVYQQLVWSPKSQELHTIEAHLDTLDSLNKLAKIEVAKGTATKMKQEADAFSEQLALLRGLVPTQNEVPAMLDMISNAARRAGLEIADVAPDGVVQGDQFDTYRYKMGVTGPYHKVADFLANVGSLPRIIEPINLSLSPTTRQTSEVKARANEQLLDAKFGIQTYVAHASLKPASGKAGQP